MCVHTVKYGYSTCHGWFDRSSFLLKNCSVIKLLRMLIKLAFIFNIVYHYICTISLRAKPQSNLEPVTENTLLRFTNRHKIIEQLIKLFTKWTFD